MDELQEICERLLRGCNGNTVLLFDKSSQTLAQVGGERLGLETLTTLFGHGWTAKNSIFEFLAEEEFAGQLADAQKTSVFLSLVKGWGVLAVLFDARSSLGLVRLRAKKATQELIGALERGPSGSPPPAAAAAAVFVAPGKRLIYKPRDSGDT